MAPFKKRVKIAAVGQPFESSPSDRTGGAKGRTGIDCAGVFADAFGKEGFDFAVAAALDDLLGPFFVVAILETFYFFAEVPLGIAFPAAVFKTCGSISIALVFGAHRSPWYPARHSASLWSGFNL